MHLSNLLFVFRSHLDVVTEPQHRVVGRQEPHPVDSVANVSQVSRLIRATTWHKSADWFQGMLGAFRLHC